MEDGRGDSRRRGDRRLTAVRVIILDMRRGRYRLQTRGEVEQLTSVNRHTLLVLVVYSWLVMLLVVMVEVRQSLVGRRRLNGRQKCVVVHTRHDTLVGVRGAIVVVVVGRRQGKRRRRRRAVGGGQ